MVKPERRTTGDLLAAAAIAVVVVVVAGADLVDQRRTGHDQQARRVSGDQTLAPPRSSRDAARAVDGAEPEDHDAGGGRRQRRHRRRARGRRPRSGHGRGRCGATRATSTCAASPRCTTTPSRSIPTAAAAVRSAPSTVRPGARADPHRYADPEVTLSSDGTTVLSAGDSRLELWRSDMVRMISYGELDARIKPGSPGPPAVPAGVGRGQLVGGVGARGVPGPARPAADAAAAGQGEDEPDTQVRAAARRPTTPAPG